MLGRPGQIHDSLHPAAVVDEPLRARRPLTPSLTKSSESYLLPLLDVKVCRSNSATLPLRRDRHVAAMVSD
jgi:hypothetical protein